MKNILKTTSWIIIVVLFIDLLGFTAWTLSGQRPVDNFYIGTITAHVLMYITN